MIHKIMLQGDESLEISLLKSFLIFGVTILFKFQIFTTRDNIQT